MNVLVIYGGYSSEREVSLRSGQSVAYALETAGHTVRLFDPKDDSFEGLERAVQGIDVAFPIIHGIGGEDGVAAAALEKLKVPFVGSSSVVSQRCLNKWETLQTVKTNGIPTMPSELVTPETIVGSKLLEKPFVLKAVTEGSSIGTYLFPNPHEFSQDDVSRLFGTHKTMLLEAMVIGAELTVPVLGNQVLPVVEIIPPAEGGFDYTNKYNGATVELCPPEHLSADIQQQAQDIALRAHTLMGCRDLSRTDCMVDTSGNLYFLEINTLPGMTEQSLYPKSAQTFGIPMPELVDQLVRMASTRR